MTAPRPGMTRNSSNPTIMLATKIGVVLNIGIGSLMLTLLAIYWLLGTEQLVLVFGNSGVAIAILIVCPGMVAMGMRDAARLRRGPDFHSMKSLSGPESEQRRRIAAEAEARANAPSHLEMSWDDYRKARDEQRQSRS